jgi:hypothetical protein
VRDRLDLVPGVERDKLLPLVLRVAHVDRDVVLDPPPPHRRRKHLAQRPMRTMPSRLRKPRPPASDLQRIQLADRALTEHRRRLPK